MKRLQTSIGAKVGAAVLILVLLGVMAGGFVGTAMLMDNGFYSNSIEHLRTQYYENQSREMARDVMSEYLSYLADEGEHMEENGIPLRDTNFRYLVYEVGNTEPVLYNTDAVPEAYQVEWRADNLMSHTSNEKSFYTTDGAYVQLETELSNFRIICGPTEVLTQQDGYYNMRYFVLAYHMRYALLPIAIVSGILSLCLFVFLMKHAGKRSGMEELHLGFVDMLPLDLYIVGLFAIAFLEVCMLDYVYYDQFMMNLEIGLFLLLDYALVLQFCMSFSIRCRTGKWWQRTILYKSWGRILHAIGYVFKNIPFIWRSILIIGVICFLEFCGLMFCWLAEDVFILWIIEKIILLPILFFILINMNQLKQAAKTLAEGRLEEKINTKHMFLDFKNHAENLNQISEGMAKAVDERMKSEHLKTELITNVSHDIKTPLTSIINYVDLLSKEKLQNPQAVEYLEVLSRQSIRLKKLIEDLIEASKASTGNLKSDMQQCEVGVMLTQAAGEYEEKLAANELKLILKQPEKDLYIMADGRHLWRVFDNLMNNINKYAQPQTRVYLNLEENQGKVQIIFRNTSRYELNISGEELMERFVRGDSSRHTEGSGLGLSIAKSLTEMMQGAFKLAVDGDLFKVTLVFPAVKKKTIFKKTEEQEVEGDEMDAAYRGKTAEHAALEQKIQEYLDEDEQ